MGRYIGKRIERQPVSKGRLPGNSICKIIQYIQNSGYIGLYGGLDVEDIHKRKGLAVGQKILDYMGSTELIANLFRISQTEEKLRKDKVDDAETATKVHGAVGREVRKAIKEIGGTMPEDLPTPEKSIAQIEKEQMARLKKKAKEGRLMLDE